MPINRLTDTTGWIDSYTPEIKRAGLNADGWDEATAYADSLLFSKQATPKQTIVEVSNHFGISQVSAKAVVDSVIEAGAKPIGPFSGSLQRKEQADSPQINDNLVYADQDGCAQRISDVLCPIHQARTVVSVKGDQGHVFHILSALEGEDAIDECINYLATGRLNCAEDLTQAEIEDHLYGQVITATAVFPDDVNVGEEFSIHFLRGLDDDIVGDLSPDLFEEANDRRPFSQ